MRVSEMNVPSRTEGGSSAYQKLSAWILQEPTPNATSGLYSHRIPILIISEVAASCPFCVHEPNFTLARRLLSVSARAMSSVSVSASIHGRAVPVTAEPSIDVAVAMAAAPFRLCEPPRPTRNESIVWGLGARGFFAHPLAAFSPSTYLHAKSLDAHIPCI